MSLWPARGHSTLVGMKTSTVIAGIAIPDSSLADDATAFVRDIETDLLYHHSLRVFVFGSPGPAPRPRL